MCEKVHIQPYMYILRDTEGKLFFLSYTYSTCRDAGYVWSLTALMVQKLCAIQLGCNGIHVAEFNFSSLFYRTAVVTAGFSWFLANTKK